METGFVWQVAVGCGNTRRLRIMLRFADSVFTLDISLRSIFGRGVLSGCSSAFVAIGDAANYLSFLSWRGGRVVEGTGLENRQARKRLEGSNPSPSAIRLGRSFLSFYRLTSNPPR